MGPLSLRAALFMQATGLSPLQLDEVIFGWGQYRDQVELLPPEEQDKIAKIADIVVASFAAVGSVPLGQITIMGHADKDFQGAIFETRVSEERARSVAAALSTAIIKVWKERKMGHFQRETIAFDIKWVGANRPDPSNVPVVRDRTRNRRVEISVRARGAPVPLPDTLERRVARFLALLATKSVDPDPTGKRTDRTKCILGKILKSGILDVFVDGTAANQQVGPHRVGGNLCSWGGNYDPPPISDPDLAKFLGRVTLILNGPGFAPSQADDKILIGLSGLIDMINQGIVRVEQYIVLNSSGFGDVGDRTRGRRLSSMFADHLDDPNSIYSCYKDFHGGE